MFVDVSCLQHRLNVTHASLAMGILKAKPSSTEVGSLVERYVEALLSSSPYLSQQIILVFEGLAEKACSEERRAKKKRQKAVCLRNMYSSSHATRGMAKKYLPSAFGRPPLWFTQRVIDRLKELQYQVILFSNSLQILIATDQADDVIISSAHADPGKVAVIASDNDFLALSMGAIELKVLPSGLFAVYIEDVLRDLDISANQYFVAYCISGNDDISVNLKGIGFATALRWVKQNSDQLTAVKLSSDFPNFDRREIEQLFMEIDQLVRQHYSPPATVPNVIDINTTIPDESAIGIHHRQMIIPIAQEENFQPGNSRATRRFKVASTKLRVFAFPYRLLRGMKDSETLPENEQKRRKGKKGKVKDGIYTMFY